MSAPSPGVSGTARADVLASEAARGVAGTAESAFWLKNLGDEEVCVAVLDGPVDVLHPCFDGARLEILEDGEVLEPSDHGTHTASLVFGQPGTSVRGVAPKCRGLLIPVFRSLGPGQPLGCSQQELAGAIRRAVAAGAHVINVSGGRITPTGEAEPELADAVRLCERRNVLVVAAVGNEGCRCLHVPAALSPVLAVGAMDGKGRPLEGSNWGKAYRAAGVIAPGSQIVGATLGAEIASRNGTSCATAIVSGMAALLVSHQRRHGLKPDPLRVRQAILESADPCDPRFGPDCRRALAGAVNVYAAQKRISAGHGVARATTAPDNGEENMKGEVDMDETMNSAKDSRTERVPATEIMDLSASPAVQPSAAGGSAGAEAGLSRQEGEDGMPQAMETGAGEAEPRVEASSGSCSCNEDPVRLSASDRPWTGACSCGGSQLVFFIGELGLNFSQTVRLDSFEQRMAAHKRSPHVINDVLKHLTEHPSDAESLVWTVGYESIPVYAVAPAGSFGAEGYARLRQLLDKQINGTVERIAFPGLIDGTVQLLCGPRIPVLVPDLRGVCGWDVKDIADKPKDVQNFLNRVFYELRSPGLSDDDRAINFAATDVARTGEVFKHAANDKLELEKIRVESSPICRPGSICRDVQIRFFDPTKRYEQARRVYRLTVDVSDTLPARIGQLRHWHIY